MAMIEIVKSPWDETLLSLAAQSRSRLRVMSPFVKEAAINQVLHALLPGAKMQLISSFNIAGFYYGASDTQAFRHVLDLGGEVRNYQQLHSKIYLFDDGCAVVTSGNLTVSGLTTNYEYGVLIRDERLVEDISADFCALWHHEQAGEIHLQTLDDIERIVHSVPKPPRVALPQPDIRTVKEQGGDEYDLIFEHGTAAIRERLTGWKLDVFDVLMLIERSLFTLSEVYDFVPELASKYPDNRNVEAKIRQQLQFLRDLGLVKFLGGGKYKKLWD